MLGLRAQARGGHGLVGADDLAAARRRGREADGLSTAVVAVCEPSVPTTIASNIGRHYRRRGRCVAQRSFTIAMTIEDRRRTRTSRTCVQNQNGDTGCRCSLPLIFSIVRVKSALAVGRRRCREPLIARAARAAAASRSRLERPRGSWCRSPSSAPISRRCAASDPRGRLDGAQVGDGLVDRRLELADRLLVLAPARSST